MTDTLTRPARPDLFTVAQQQFNVAAENAGLMTRLSWRGLQHASEKEMADCDKCCEEMMAKMHEGHPKHGEHKPR